MGKAKLIVLKPVSRKLADACVKQHHYSGKSVQNSQVHIGVYLNGVMEGAMQFGPCMDKRKTQQLVEGTKWNGFIELNRMAFGPKLPRNSESRALSIAMRLLKKHRPELDWVISFADGAQCGDGTIYRAAGFVLTSIKVNKSLIQMPNGKVIAHKSLGNFIGEGGRWGSAIARDMGALPLPGFQLRYLYPLKPGVIERLTCKVLPYSAINEAGAGMYKGVSRQVGAE